MDKEHRMTRRPTERFGDWVAGLVMVFVVGTAAIAQQSPNGTAATEPSPVLVTVNDQPITQADLEFLYFTRRVPEPERARVRERLLNDLIDQKLMSRFLESRNVQVEPVAVASRIAAVRALIERSGHAPEDVFQKLGITEEMLQRTLSLPLAWNQHVRQIVTEEQITEHFRLHRRRLDGSRVRISQIVRTLSTDATDADREAAVQTLNEIRQQVTSGSLRFDEAARLHSQSPSKERGGDVGWIGAGQGASVPGPVRAVAYSLEAGQVSEPLTTTFGVHLVTVTEIQPGLLSQEDVRGEILDEIGKPLWQEQLAREREQARIVRPGE